MSDNMEGQQPEEPSGPAQQQPSGGAPPPGGQPGWSQPPSAPPADPHGLGPTSMGMAAHVAGALSYVLGWLTGLIFFLCEKQNRFVRFHAMQSIVLSGAWFVLWIVLQVILVPVLFSAAASGGAGGVSVVMCIVWILSLAYFAGWLICIIMAATGKWFKIPFIGDLAMKWSGN
ncbi:MAG: hypothetical protein AKCLJLPJ_00587 [Fimbriimonadales bacterium]|nr:MAG: hypothetical protein EDM73_02955 [Armatimonadota bacterium]MBV6502540.1 hypothetical protein [Fimbriimonadales bacterium]MCE7898616.1 hypothetical protein [Armatimonadetes bacterium ATM1]RIJ98340.1 MAG: hypothetical protein DCC45_00820 [Armatimonadota bacterium]